MVVGVKPFSLRETFNKKVNSLITAQHRTMVDTIELYKGRLVKQNPNYFLVSFDSVTNAVQCALKMRGEFEKESDGESSSIKLKIGLSAGVPVDEKEGFFENTIKTAHSYFDWVKRTVVMSSEVKDLYESENLNVPAKPNSFIVLNRAEEKFLKDLLDFMEKEWNKTSLQINDLSRYMGYSKSGLYRRLMAITGKSPNTFLKDYRLSKALDLLNKKNMNISEVAFETGFNSPAYFSKCFQETFGILPSHYMSADNA